MFIIKKNQIVITALVVMIAAAGYLNYIDTNPSMPSEVLLTDEGDIVALVPNDGSGDVAVTDENVAIATDDSLPVSADIAASSDDAGSAVFVNSSNDSSFFIQAKLDREQSRAKQKDLLNEVINNNNVEQSKKTEAADNILAITQRIEKETAAESMIEAKGFKEVYVRIDDDTVDVVVDKTELTQAEIAQIEDIVKRKTGVSAEKIRITPIKKQ